MVAGKIVLLAISASCAAGRLLFIMERSDLRVVTDFIGLLLQDLVPILRTTSFILLRAFPRPPTTTVMLASPSAASPISL